MRRGLLPYLLILALSALSTRAQTAAGTAAPGPDTRPFYARIPGIFDFSLPSIDPPGTVKLILYPHLSDLIRRDYMRVDGGFRWALNERFEFSPEAAAYFSHGLGDGGTGVGIGLVRLSFKYVLPRWPAPDLETSVFLTSDTPVDHPPVDMTDGLNHFAPGFLVQHHSERNPRLTMFGGAGCDLISDSTVAGTPSGNQPRDDALNFTLGGIYDTGQIKWTLAATYATTAWLGSHTDHFLHVNPSVLWYVPKRMTLNSKTRWIVGLGANVSWGPDGNQLSFNTRLRAEITFRQVMDKMMSRKPGGDSVH